MGISNETSVQAISLFVGLLYICILLDHLLKNNRWISKTTLILLMGSVAGALILLLTQGRTALVFKFDEQLFFNYVLPPIIFNAGFEVRKKQFFRNFSTITLYGAIGTLISFGVISSGAYLLFKPLDVGSLDARDYFALGAIFAATDSVSTLQVLNQEDTPLVYSLVFGESVVNDAMSLVLFHVIQRFDYIPLGADNVVLLFTQECLYLSVFSILLGVFIALLCAYTTKKMSFGGNSPLHEISAMILMAYLSYMLAELFNLSGILSVFFCGMSMSHYTSYNVTEISRTTTKHMFATMSDIAEKFIFLYVGMDALDVQRWEVVLHRVGTSLAVSSSLLILVLLGRAMSIFPLSYLVNLTKRDPDEKIELKRQVIIWWAGLMRGSVTMALAYSQFTKIAHTHEHGGAIMITSTISVIYFSTVVFGTLTKPLLRLLVPSSTITTNIRVCSESSSPKSTTVPLLWNLRDSDAYMAHNIATKSTLSMLITKPTKTVHYYWRRFDRAYMRPFFRASEPTPDDFEDIYQAL
ncbi:sodium/hydrogen exchanger 1-like [Silene latifolia]|uniref:sodium/hydrogen exchanger 1-like n=1 Tax=Silene latifolia TaxID=37657 RepID=UPI003D77CB4D